ncbi:MAG: hypothetical protein A2046_05145 [Bacteroidetes bacterium GWA2_30_7]|nr:MAG: hypothetical protein A2046_05145 [Bacteroidetes bacterium GWA2_30_7]
MQISENKTILIIDDEPSNIQIIYNILQSSESSFKIISSSSSTLGLTIAMKAKPDIIITDWEMPEMTGIDIIIELQKSETTKEIPIIIATGVNMSSLDLKYALDSGAYDFVRKPIDESELLARVNSALRIIDYYNIKIEIERQLEKIKSEKNQNEIESKKRELLAKTLLLIKINKLNMAFNQELERIKHSDSKSDCEVFNFALNYTDEILKNGNESIWNELEVNFEQINEKFYTNLIYKFPSITPNERKLCAFLRLNLSTKDISSITFQTVRSIEIARTRLRDKFGLKGAETDLHTFLLGF